MSNAVIKTAFTRAWNDIEPKVLAWLATGGLLTAVTVVLHYFGVLDIPFWVPIVVTYVAGFVAAYLKKSKVAVIQSDGDHEAAPAVTEIPETPAP